MNITLRAVAVLLGIALLTGCCVSTQQPDTATATTATTTAAVTTVTTTATTRTTTATKPAKTTGQTAVTVKTTTTAKVAPKAAPQFPDMESEVLRLINAERTQVGAAPLTMAYEYYACAETRANECLVRWSHTRPDDRPWHSVYGDFGLLAGVRVCGENLAKNFRTPKDMVEALMASPGHRANILNEVYDGVTISIVAVDGWDGLYAMSQLFIARREKEECV